MNTATATIVEEKRLPIEAAAIEPPQVITVQGLFAHFQEFRQVEAADADANGKRSAKKCAILVATVLDGLKAPTPEQFNTALSGVVEMTRVTVKGANGKEKREKGADTDMAAKFASYVRAAFAAVKAGRMTTADLLEFTNSQKLYDTARKACAESENQPRIDRNGYAVTPASEQAKAEAKAAEAAAKFAVTRGLTPEQTTALKQAAVAGVQQKRIESAAERLNKRAQTLADRIAEELGVDDGEKFALAVVALIQAKRAEVVAAQ